MEYALGMSLAERAVSGFPVSIGTSLALESLFNPIQTPYDPERKIPNRADLEKTDTCWFNITTMFRNLVGAIDKSVYLKARAEDFGATLLEEMGVIEGLFSQFSPHCRPVFYYSTYDDLRKAIASKRIIGVFLREPNTENQKYYQNLLLNAIKYIDKHTESVLKFNDAVRPKRYENAIILTHQPYDLVDFMQFRDVELLESNTGVLKPRFQWNTKYHPFGEKSLHHLPFNRKLLLCMGDKSLIKPGPLPLRKQILETSLNRHWTPTTTLDKINLELGLDVRDPYMLAVLNSMNRS